MRRRTSEAKGAPSRSVGADDTLAAATVSYIRGGVTELSLRGGLLSNTSPVRARSLESSWFLC